MIRFNLDRTFAMQTYKRQPVCFVRGDGARLYDSGGKEYIDLLSGIAVCGLGHSHPAVTKAIAEQAGRLMHCSNLFVNEWQPELAERLATLTGLERAFFCNSGAEAVECALKIARKFGRNKGLAAPEVISFEGAFHGRTMGALSATPNPVYQDGFKPMVPGFVVVPRNDLTALKAAINPNTCAVIVEAIQGESGVYVMDQEYLVGVRKLCDDCGILLIADEIQCGMYRTGLFLAIEVKPDIVTLAKGLANGLPIGVCLASGLASKTLQPGDHGSTFGGNPLVCRVALTVLDETAKLAVGASKLGAELMNKLTDVDGVVEVRGRGLIIGVGLAQPVAGQVAAELLEAGFVVNAVWTSTIRLLPPLIIGWKECDSFVGALDRAIKGCEAKGVLA